MKKIWERGVLTCCIVLSLCVFPLCLVRSDVNVDVAPQGPLKTENTARELKQTFVAQTSYLSEVDFDIAFPDGKPETGDLTVQIMEEDGKVIVQKTLPLSDVNDNAYTPVSAGKWVRKGNLYSFAVSGGYCSRPFIRKI